MIDCLIALAPWRPWVVLPCSDEGHWPGGHLELLDWLLRDPGRRALERGFFSGAEGQTLAVKPAVGGFAGLLLVGYRSGNHSVDQLGRVVAHALPRDLLRGARVLVLPPEPYDPERAAAWIQAGDRLRALFEQACPDADAWLVEDLLRDLI